MIYLLRFFVGAYKLHLMLLFLVDLIYYLTLENFVLFILFAFFFNFIIIRC